MKKLAKTLFFVVFISFCSIIFLTGYYSYKIPQTYKMFVGQKPEFNFFGVDFEKIEQNIPINRPSKKFIDTEFYKAKLLGFIPIKNVSVKKYNKVFVIPCGTPFGVKFLTKGVMVVDTQKIATKQGEKNPSKDAGLKKGDIIEYVNEEAVNCNDDIKNIVLKNSGGEIKLKYNRNFKQYETTLTPVLSKKERKWLTGLWVRDSSAGIGTTTFCTEDGIFGGLGHAVCDVDTGDKLPLGTGEIVEASISGVKKGICGSPGELSGTFLKDKVIGHVKINTDCGLYGKFYRPIHPHEPVMIGFKQEAKVGSAYIYSTIDGKESKKYSVLIESVDSNSKSRNFVIKITDKELLDKTGGIVQGMSGSPIIQNNKIIGAVTHVFLNDSTRGYGVFAETMLEVSDELQNSYME